MIAHRALALIVFVGTVALTVVLFINTPKGYFPQDDTGLIFGGTQASTDISFEAMEKLQQKAMDIVLADPAVAGLGSNVGGGLFGASVNNGRLFISLKPLDERDNVPTAAVIGAAARQTEQHSRPARLPGAVAGSARRRPAEQFAVSVHAVEPGHRRSCRPGCRRSWTR